MIVIGLSYNHSREAIKRLLLALVLALLLSLAFIVPFLDYYFNANLAASWLAESSVRERAANHAAQISQLLTLSLELSNGSNRLSGHRW